MSSSHDVILQMTDIVKTFPGVLAVNKMNFTVRRGTVHALMGENGAGKSTLMKILVGLYPCDSGEIIFQGKPLDTANPNRVLHQGISMIYQEMNPVDVLTVAENVFCGKEPAHGRFALDRGKMIRETETLLKRLKIDSITPQQKVETLSMGQKQMLEIAKAIANNSSLIVMDEPTSALTEKESQALLDVVDQLRREGISFIFITHKIEKVLQIADDVTVMRDGCFAGKGPISEFTHERIVTMMVGRQLTEIYPKEDVPRGEECLRVEHLSAGPVHDVSFTAHRGEILGFAGLMGSGRTETLEAVFGCRKKSAGRVFIDGKPVRIRRPQDAIRRKMAFLTEDRRGLGCFLELSVFDNIMALSWDKGGSPFYLRMGKCRRIVEEQVKKRQVKTPKIQQLAANLSGGNQQKMLLARWMLTEPEILILDEPTRGIDVGARHEIYKSIVELAKAGKTIIMISSDMPEVIGMSDRVVVMHEGRISGVLERGELDQETIMRYAAGLNGTAAGCGEI